jgi:16S rRNA (guanine527-N7)-methyltransferase
LLDPGSKTPLDPPGFARLSGVSRETLARLEAYAGLLAEWSAHINLVGATTLDDPWRRHFLDSAQLLQFIPAGTRSLIDLGSGAGFPGLVLAISGVSGVELVEADARKCAFLREAARITAAPVILHNMRIETVPPHVVDVVTARGCAPLDRLLVLAQPFIGPDTVCLFPKGERVEHELATARQAWTMDLTRHPSRSNPRGVILCLRRIGSKRRGLGPGGRRERVADR